MDTMPKKLPFFGVSMALLMLCDINLAHAQMGTPRFQFRNRSESLSSLEAFGLE